jgi:phosphoesterase RecJ-like protein
MPPWKTIAELIRKNSSFLVSSHVQPDGDAIGSMTALGFILQEMGKEFTLLNASGLPSLYSWVELPAPLLTSCDQAADQVALVLDCGDDSRLGEARQTVMSAREVVNIDHHQGNTEFGSLNWVEPTRSSVGEMIGQLAKELEIELSGPLGEAVYLAMITDTGFFTYSNTQAGTLQLAAEIIRSGLDLNSLNRRMQRQWSLNKVRLHGRAMQDVRLRAQGLVGVIGASREMLETTGTSAEDCEGLVNYVRSIRGVVVAVSLRQDDRATVKFSLRSWGEVDVQAVASALGGGGHRNAAGGVLENVSMPEAEDAVVAAVSLGLEQSGFQEMQVGSIHES